MTHISVKPDRSAMVARSIAIAACAAVGLTVFAVPAQARWGDKDERWGEKYDRRGDHHRWYGDRGYYRTPPPVYQQYYQNEYRYYPPPVVYGPGFGLNFNIR